MTTSIARTSPLAGIVDDLVREDDGRGFEPDDAEDRAARNARPACADEDPELFFPHSLALLQIEEAKAVCRRCPLMQTCLQDALDRNEHFGVWGGASEDERRAIKRRAARNCAADTAAAAA